VNASSTPTCFAALGDSFTAGTGCPPGTRWPDLLAESLRADGSELAYLNLAWEGATSADVLRQVEVALQSEPDLVTVVCGANDVLESPRPDLDRFAERLGSIFDSLLSTLPSTLLLTATVPEQWRFLQLGPRTTRRVRNGIAQVNEHIRELAAQRTIPYLEVVGHPGLDEPQNFSSDGLHPSPLGHAHAAREFQRLLARQLPERPMEALR
jgi:lysophospholipase L1-like esterase